MNSIVPRTMLFSILSLLQVSPAYSNDQTSKGAVPVQSHLAFSTKQIQAQDRTFQLITQDIRDPKKQEFGAAFAIDSAGVLVTPYHSVASVVINPQAYRLDLNLDNELLPAKILTFDVASDLALIQVDRKLTQTYSLAIRAPLAGEKLLSIGFIHNSGVTQVEGQYHDAIQSGPISRYLISLPLGRTASEELIVNLSGELIGVSNTNRVPFKDNTQVFSVITPGGQVAELIRRSRIADRKPSSANPSQDVIKQVDFTLTPWLQQWRSIQWKTNTARLDRFQVSDPAPNMKCWEDKSKKEFLQNTIRRIVCSTQLSFPISAQKEAGKLSVYYSVIADSSNVSDFLKLNDQTLTSNFKALTGKNFDQTVREGNPNPRYNCHHRFVRTQNEFSTLAEYCMTPVESIPGFYDFLLTATSVSSGRTFVAELELQGFSSSGIKLATELFLNGIKEGPPL